jgi:hypothetical protein
MDLPTDFVEEPKQVTEIYKNYLTEGYKGIIIRMPEAYYEWEEVDFEVSPVYKLYPKV